MEYFLVFSKTAPCCSDPGIDFFFCSVFELLMITISRVPDQNGISQACSIVKIYHSDPEPLILYICKNACSSGWLAVRAGSYLCLTPN